MADPKSFGAIQITPVGAVKSVLQIATTTGAAIASSGGAGSAGIVGISTGGGAVVGVSALALGVVGLAISIISVVYNLVAGHAEEVKVHRQARENRQMETYLTGRDLISEIYGVEIPGWSHAFTESTGGFGEYMQLGSLFTWWSQSSFKNAPTIALQTRSGPVVTRITENLESWLHDQGLEPTRFMGYDNVDPKYILDYSNYEISFVADPEKALVAKEALSALGYSSYQINSLSQPFLVRWFDILIAIPRAVNDTQARLVMQDMNTHLKLGRLDPNVMISLALKYLGEDSKLFMPPVVPSPTGGGLTVVDGTLLGKTELGISKASMSPWLVAGLIGAAIMMLSSPKRGKKERVYV